MWFHRVAGSERLNASMLEIFLRSRLKVIFYLIFNFGAITMGFVFLLRVLLCKTCISNLSTGCTGERAKLKL